MGGLAATQLSPPPLARLGFGARCRRFVAALCKWWSRPLGPWLILVYGQHRCYEKSLFFIVVPALALALALALILTLAATIISKCGPDATCDGYALSVFCRVVLRRFFRMDHLSFHHVLENSTNGGFKVDGSW
jgi:hypothetical protein